ncbi:MAG: membrane protein insertase YidC [Candidatus Aminicenantes bacterium]|jgi:YidC/Oxa1 family membrane protein insertase
MEKRLLIAIVLSFVVLFLYQALFVPKQPPPEPIPESIPQEVTRAEDKPNLQPLTESEPAQVPEDRTEPQEPVEFQPVSGEREEQIFVDTPLYRGVWSNKGAVLKSWRLKRYENNEGEDLELVSARAEEIGIYPFVLRSNDPDFDRKINTALYNISSRRIELTEGQSETLRFEYADNEGLRVEKILTFEGGSYGFNTQINVWKNGQKIETDVLWGPGLGNPSPEEQKKRFGGSSGIAVHYGDKFDHLDARKYKPEQSVFPKEYFIKWAGYEDQYFTALCVTSPQQSRVMFLKEDIGERSYFFLSVNNIQDVYLGPKQHDALKAFGHNSSKIIKYGFFGMIAEILYQAIKTIHNAVPNWGFSIIILTIIIKIIFFPLTYSSTKSMAKMQELQPKIKALKAKYKKAKQDIAQRRKMNEETMALYKEHGVNPAGGCLPMLIQLPIFWGFFRLLVVSIEFRHSPFILWINDLSVKDPYYVTPILMGITQYISQKMTPTSADPTQQRMMLIMPVIMTIFFMNFQSGLVLYWLTNNILQIGQQYIMNRIMKKKKRESHGKKRKK